MATSSAPSAPLSPPEAYFLLDQKRATGAGAFRVALLYLLSAGHVKVGEREIKVLFRKKKVPCLSVAAAKPPILVPHLSKALDVVRQAQAKGGLLSDVASAGHHALGDRFESYLRDFVVAALMRRGLVEERRKFLVRTYGLTPAGTAAHERIAADVARARTLPELLQTDPARAARLALALGGTLLLLEEFNKHHARILSAIRAQAEEESGGDADVDPPVTNAEKSAPHVEGGIAGATHLNATEAHGDSLGTDVQGFDFGSFDFGSFDLGAVDMASLDFGSFDGGGADSSASEGGSA